MYINFQNPIYTASKSRYLVVRNATQFRFNSRNHGYQNRVGKLSIRRNPVSVFSSSSSGQYNQYIKQKDVGKNDSDDEEEAEESQDQQRRNGPFTRARKLVQFIFLQFKKVLMGILSIFKMLLPIGDNKYRSVQILISFILGAWFLLSTDPGQKGRSTKFPKEVKYSNFVQYINQGQVKSVQFEENTSRVYFWIENQKDAQTQNQNLEQSIGSLRSSYPLTSSQQITDTKIELENFLSDGILQAFFHHQVVGNTTSIQNKKTLAKTIRTTRKKLRNLKINSDEMGRLRAPENSFSLYFYSLRRFLWGY
eukprot:TRINITY_DN3723_c1_g2_i6.p1 TRINITY_DN3723_c1_g2~~TRINITY_DN3723_c1_g2_i6.p1  ORF type:complete len:308 (+),score=13.05 TRINITY_DN3723_c1_g2_i6:277-1200(+)